MRCLVYVKSLRLQSGKLIRSKLPNSNKLLPEYLDKTYGINKQYELTSLNDIYSYILTRVSSYIKINIHFIYLQTFFNATL